MKISKAWLSGIIALIVALAYGRSSQNLFTSSELIHFSANFPTMPGYETLDREEVGGDWARTPDEEWVGYPAGGLLAYGDEGEVIVDLGKQGWIKRLLQPNFISLSSHWIRNISTEPIKVHLEMDLCDLDLEWETFEKMWDPVENSSTRYIPSGIMYNMDWYFHIPGEIRDQTTICAGALEIFDAETNALLTHLPITIINSKAE